MRGVSCTRSGLGNAPSKMRQPVLIENVQFTGSGINNGSGTFRRIATAIHVAGLEHVRIRNVTAESDNTPGHVAVYLSAFESGGLGATDVHVHHATLVNWDLGLSIAGTIEGVMLTDSAIIGCKTGVTANLYDDLRAGLFVRGNHLNCRETAIHAGNMARPIVTDNLIYLDYTASANAIGINTGTSNTQARDFQIRGNTIIRHRRQGFNASPIGILVPGSTGGIESGIISDNVIVDCDVGVWLQPGSKDAFLTHSNRYRACGTNYLNQGANTIQL